MPILPVGMITRSFMLSAGSLLDQQACTDFLQRHGNGRLHEVQSVSYAGYVFIVLLWHDLYSLILKLLFVMR